MTTAQTIFKKGDSIHCIDAEHAGETADALCSLGYEWEFCYEKYGKPGIWIDILGRPDDKEENNDKK